MGALRKRAVGVSVRSARAHLPRPHELATTERATKKNAGYLPPRYGFTDTSTACHSPIETRMPTESSGLVC